MLSVVGISYGNQWLCEEAINAIKSADTIIAHQPYIDDVKNLLKKGVNAFDVLTDIREGENFLMARVRHAIQAVDNNQRTVILSNGDANIYGMSGAVFRELARVNRMDIFRETKVVPGISALQLAASRLGGPLSNGFSTLALCIAEMSKKSVEDKIKGCAIGDFVCVVYMLRHNAELCPALHPEIKDPRALSNERIIKMIQVFKENRHNNTPCVIASELGCKDETLIHVILEDLDQYIDDITANSILLIGSNKTMRLDNMLVEPTW